MLTFGSVGLTYDGLVDSSVRSVIRVKNGTGSERRARRTRTSADIDTEVYTITRAWHVGTIRDF